MIKGKKNLRLFPHLFTCPDVNCHVLYIIKEHLQHSVQHYQQQAYY